MSTIYKLFLYINKKGVIVLNNNLNDELLAILKFIFKVGKSFKALADTFAIDSCYPNDIKKFTDDIGGYSYANSWCRTYANGITSTEDKYGNLQFSNGEYATKTSYGYYYFSNGVTGYEDSYGDIHLDNGQVIIMK